MFAFFINWCFGFLLIVQYVAFLFFLLNSLETPHLILSPLYISKSCLPHARFPYRRPSLMNWKAKLTQCVKKNSYNRTRFTMAHWRTYCWDWRANHIVAPTQFGAVNVDALIIIDFLEHWKNWMYNYHRGNKHFNNKDVNKLENKNIYLIANLSYKKLMFYYWNKNKKQN